MKIRCIWALSTAANRQPKPRAFTPAGPTTTTFPLWQRSSGGNAAASAALPCGGPVRRRPGAQPNGNPLPHAGAPPPPLRRLPGGRRKDGASTGGGGVWRPGGPRAPGPAKQKSRGRRQSLAPAFQGASRPAAAPGPLELPPPPKRQRKARPHALWGRAHQTMVGRGAATIPPPGAKPLPMPYGQRRHSPPAAGRCPRATPPAVARLSPPA